MLKRKNVCKNHFPDFLRLQSRQSIWQFSATVLIVYTDIVPFQTFADTHGNVICKVYWHGVSNHFVTDVYIFINKNEIVGECLNSCHFSDCHSAI